MQNPKKTISRKSANLNEKIANYYYKYGQNRNLEKYLRLKSSSEGSISTPESTTKNATQSPDENDDSTTRKSIDKFKKKFNINCESNIAITIPCIERSSMPNLSTNIPDPITEASQTDFESIKPEENIVDIKTPPNHNQQQILIKTPESILKSTSKRLEWDSLADVGYEKNTLTNNKSSSLSTLERSVLKDFFADKGIEINFPNNKTKYDNNRLPKINEETNKKSISQGAIPKLQTKEKWRETLENVQKKYRSLPSLTEPNATGISNNMSEFKDISTYRHSTPKIIGLEKFCQTSLKKNTQEIQCNFSNSESVGSAFEVGSMTSQSSFEYIPQVLESEASCSNKENISPINSQKDTIEQKLRKSVSKLFELQKNSSVNEKSFNEIDLGIQLLCSLIESKKMSDQQKKILAKKIIGKITKSTTQSCENQSSNMTSTRTKSASISSSLSMSSLIGTNNTNKNCLSNKNKNNEQLIMSGVESMNSNKTNEKSSKSKSELVSCRSSFVPKTELIKQQSLDENIEFYNNKKSVCKMEDKSNQVNVDSLMKNLQIENNPREYDSTTSGAETATTKSETTDDQDTMREWLDPITRSEIKYEDMQRRKCIKPLNYISGNVVSGEPSSTNMSKHLMGILEKEKKAHFDWIELEIKRLEQLKCFLTKDEKLNVNSMANCIPENNVLINRKYDVVENVIDEKSKSNSSAESSCKNSVKISSNKSSINSKKPDSNKSPNSVNYSNDIEEINIEFVIKDKKNNVIYDDAAGTASNTKTKNKLTKKIKNKKKSECINQDRKTITENSGKHRSKLETPPQNIERTESVRSFARQKKLDFIEVYKHAHSRDYDCPAETDHYSEPRNDNKRSFINNNKPFTSGSSSNLFISSESISIPITSGAASSSMTTTHQYDSRCGIGIQTSDSVLDTYPINDIQCPRKPTQRIYLTGKDQQVQVKPVTISYVLKFSDNDDKCTNSKPIMYTESVEYLTLEERFKKSRPKFYSNVLERQEILRTMQKRRQSREEKIRDIVENTSIRSIPRKLDQLPPPATKYTRIFSTKEMKAMTKRKQTKFPEVLKKIEQQKNDRKKKGNQILKDVFNKRLQRRVHKGKLSLEHSQTVI